METMLLRIFQTQVLLQCDFMYFAADELNAALRTQDINRSINRAFFAIQNLLGAAANISKALWGPRGSKSTERKELRDSIGISDTSPLRQVTMRNNFEHFDDRLDKWWVESPRHNCADLILGPAGALGGLDEIDMFRIFDPASTDVVFWGQRFNIQALMNEVDQIVPRLRTALSRQSPGLQT